MCGEWGHASNFPLAVWGPVMGAAIKVVWPEEGTPGAEKCSKGICRMPLFL
ncbi:unnamed protein product [Bathycoccus prasinos]